MTWPGGLVRPRVSGQWSHGPVVPALAPMWDISTEARGWWWTRAAPRQYIGISVMCWYEKPKGYRILLCSPFSGQWSDPPMNIVCFNVSMECALMKSGECFVEEWRAAYSWVLGATLLPPPYRAWHPPDTAYLFSVNAALASRRHREGGGVWGVAPPVLRAVLAAPPQWLTITEPDGRRKTNMRKIESDTRCWNTRPGQDTSWRMVLSKQPIATNHGG